MNFTTIDRIIGKLYRDLRNTPLHETDVIEWIGEALEFLKVPEIQEEAVSFFQVENYEADLPVGFHLVIQIARDRLWTTTSCPTAEEIAEALAEEAEGSPKPVIIDCHGKPLVDYEVAYYRPLFDLQWEYYPWVTSLYYRQRYTPVRLANHSFFNSLVCREGEDAMYAGVEDEYTLVGSTEKKLRFSFKDGFVAMAYLKNQTDPETGYPLVPDQISFITAITYYVEWKIAEWWSWNGREGSIGLSQDRERKWLKYVKQAKNHARMPKSTDQFQNMLDESHYILPRTKKYYGYFGKLGRPENRIFSDPDYRRRFTPNII